MSEKRPYSNQVNHYCQKCKRYTLHIRGRKYYSCLTCCTKEERGLTQPAPDAAPQSHFLDRLQARQTANANR